MRSRCRSRARPAAHAVGQAVQCNAHQGAPLAVRNSCSKQGMFDLVRSLRLESLVGTRRQPRTDRFSSAAICSMLALALAASSGSVGRKALPTAYAPCRGVGTPPRCGESIGNLQQHAGPVTGLGSAPVAPRWSRFRSACRPWAMMSWLAIPVRVATKATPQHHAQTPDRKGPQPCGPSKGMSVVIKPTPVVEAGEQSRGLLPRVTAERHGLRGKCTPQSLRTTLAQS